MGEVTLELHRLAEGDRSAIERLLPMIYEDLRAIAASKLRSERPDHTLQTTALVNEFCLKLFSSQASISCEGRRQFFGLASEMMRRLLIDSARAHHAKKRAGTVQLGDALGIMQDESHAGLDFDLLIDLDIRLTALEKSDPISAEVVKLRLFSGLSFREIAAVMEISRSRAHDEWTYARCWLAAYVNG